MGYTGQEIIARVDFADYIKTRIAEFGQVKFESSKTLSEKVAYNDALVDVLEAIKEGLVE